MLFASDVDAIPTVPKNNIRDRFFTLTVKLFSTAVTFILILVVCTRASESESNLKSNF